MNHIQYILDELRGEISPENQRVLDEWKSSSEEHRVLYDEWVKTWTLTGNFPTDFSEEKRVSREFLDRQIHDTKRSRGRILRFAAAAAILLLLLSAGLNRFFQSSKPESVKIADSAYFSEDKISDITLPDGTRLRLEPNTTLHLNPGFDKQNRSVILTGGAFFDVQKNKALPFIVKVEGFEVKVLGTAFYISDHDLYKRAKVSVVRGLVKVRTEKDSVRLQAGETIIVATVEQKLFRSKFKPDFVQLPSTPIIFDQTPILQVAKKISELYEVKITVKGYPSQCRFTGKFDGESIEQIIRILKKAVGVGSIRQTDGSYVWIVKKC